MISFSTERFRSGSVTLVADVGGGRERPAVIFLHGGGQTRHSWGKAAREVVRIGYRAISLDLRGHGESDWAPDRDYALDAYAADLRAVISTIPGRPTLVGASLGGLTSLVTVGESDIPIASGLVLVDVVPKIEEDGKRRVLDFMSGHPDGFATLSEAADAVAAYSPHRPRSANPEGLRKNLRLRSDGRLYWHWDPEIIRGPHSEPGPAWAMRLEAAAHRISVPTLILRGSRSDVVSMEGVRELQRAIPGAEFAEVDGAGHMIAGDKNDTFNHAISEFLLRHVPRR
jgi:non-heme chloroperoxidase